MKLTLQMAVYKPKVERSSRVVCYNHKSGTRLVVGDYRYYRLQNVLMGFAQCYASK